LSEPSELQRLEDEFSEKQKRNEGTFFFVNKKVNALAAAEG